MSSLSIVIVNLNASAMLVNCLASIEATSANLAPEIWVVDNGSSDNSVEMVRNVFPAVHTITSDTNLGFAAGNNRALIQATGDYLLLLNNDTIVHPEAFQRMVQTLDANPEVGILGPMLRNADGSVQPSCLHFPNFFKGIFNYFRARSGAGSAKYNPERTLPYAPVDAVIGACMMVRRQVIEQIGLLDEGYFFYAEEVDWCYRAHKAGWKTGWLANAEVTHLGGQSAAKEADRFYVERRFSRIRYHWKHHGAVAANIDAALIRANIRLNGLLAPSERARSKKLLALLDTRMRALKTEARTQGVQTIQTSSLQNS